METALQNTPAETQQESLGLIDQILEETTFRQEDSDYAIAKRGVAEFVSAILEKEGQELEPVNKRIVDAMIAEIDKKLSAQIDAILHHSGTQQLESAWKGLKLLVDRVDFRENIKLEFIHATKEELLEDFEDAPEIVQSGLYKQVYKKAYGQFGADPYGLMIGNYQFGPSTPDIKLLGHVASVGAMAHAPFIAAAGHEFFSVDAFTDLPNRDDIKDFFEAAKFTKWRSLRESEDARYLGLTMPRFLLRTPYDPEENPIKSFVYKEVVDDNHEKFLWGNTAFLMATCIANSFAKYRWCPNIIGPQSGGAIEDLPLHLFEAMGQQQMKIPTEILIDDRKEFEISEEGFIPLVMRKDSDNAAFFSANSSQLPKNFPKTKEGLAAQTNYKLGTQLPYMFIINRLAHYIKVLQREQIGSWKERQDLERELNNWIKQYIADQENPPADVRSERPLRAARIEVADVEGDPGWYQVSLAVRPHFKYMGAYFELSLVGKLDKE